MQAPARPVRRLRSAALSLVAAAFALNPAWSLAANGECGQPLSNGVLPTISDALSVLKTAVAGKPLCDRCVCDVNNDIKINTVDALRVLKKAVKLPQTLACPPCPPSLKGVVSIPPDLQAAALVSRAEAPALPGALEPAAGVKVELLSVTAAGLPVLPVIAATTSGSDGSFKFTPLPPASSQTIVRATVLGQTMRAFVSAERLSVDPFSEFVVAAAFAGIAAKPGSGLSMLTVTEILGLEDLARDSAVDFAGVTSIAGARTLVGEQTGGVYNDFAGDFASGNGPAVSLAGNFHVVEFSSTLARSFQSGSLGVASVNERSVEATATADPASIGGDGAITQGTRTGGRNTLTEISGSIPQNSGPEVAVNAEASLASSTINDVESGSGASLFASNHGALLLRDGDGNAKASPGILAAGSGFGIVAQRRLSTPAGSSATNSFDFALRQGTTLTNASLTGTYPAVQFEFDLGANSDSFNVHRDIQGYRIAGTIGFDGNGHFTLGAFNGLKAALTKEGPPPNKDPILPSVSVGSSAKSETGQSGLTYTLTAKGLLTIKQSGVPVAVGAVTADRNVIVLRLFDADSGQGAAGFLIALRPGSGLTNASAKGTYRSLELMLRLEANEQIGSPDVQPDVLTVSIGEGSAIGSIDFDGAGHVDVLPSMNRSATLIESYQRQRHTVGTDTPSDATVAISTSTEPENTEGQTHTYSVSSKGVVTVDAANNGGMKGYLSPDGNVFLLPIADEDQAGVGQVGVLIALREP